MGAAGSPYAAFRRAVDARNLTRALTEARDLPQLSLADAAELLVLAAEHDAPSFERWASRWAARFVLENPVVTLEAQLVVAALAGLRRSGHETSASALVTVLTARNRRDLAAPFLRLLTEEQADR